MWSRDFTQRGNRIALMIGQLIIFLMCAGYIFHTYTSNIFPDKEAKESFKQNTCFIISKKLSTRGHFFHEYRADILITYNVSSVQYNRWVSGNGLDYSFAQNESSQEDVLSQFDVGGTYPCWYNPNNPQIAILVMRHNWLSTFPLMLPSVVAVIIFYYLMKNLFLLINAMKSKSHTDK
jgi:hypothetical protein